MIPTREAYIYIIELDIKTFQCFGQSYDTLISIWLCLCKLSRTEEKVKKCTKMDFAVDMHSIYFECNKVMLQEVYIRNKLFKHIESK